MIRTGSNTLDILFSALNFLISQGDTTAAFAVAAITIVIATVINKTKKTKKPEVK